MTLKYVPYCEEIEYPVAHLQEGNIDIGNTESTNVCLKNNLEKNDTNQNCEATTKSGMEEKWLKILIVQSILNRTNKLKNRVNFLF